MELKEGLEIKNYKDFLENKVVCFKLIEGVMDLMVKEMVEKNPTFTIPDYDKLIDYKKVYTTPLENNRALKVYLE